MTKIPAGWKQELFQLNIAIEYVDWEMDDVALYPHLMDMMQRNEFPKNYKAAMCLAKRGECRIGTVVIFTVLATCYLVLASF